MVCGGDDVEIVLDHDHGITGLDETVEHLQQHRGVVEVQSRGRLVEEEERGFAFQPFLHGRGEEMTDELEPLALAP